MTKTFPTLAVLLVLACSSAATAAADDLPDWIKRTKVHGLAFGDLYWLAQSDDVEIEGQSGFWIRRVYLGVDTKLDERFTSRVRFEAGHPGDFTTKKKLDDPFLKDVWLRYESGHHAVVAGVQPSLMFETQEGLWGYRSLEKTPQDLYKLGGSRELGLSYAGTFGADDLFKLEAQAGNGQDANETNDGKKAALGFTFAPKSGLSLSAYADHDVRPEDSDVTTFQLFAALRRERFRVGLLALRQERDVEGEESAHIGLASVFAIVETGTRGALLLRYDRLFDPLPGADGIDYLPLSSVGEIGLLIVGYDFRATKSFSLIPNVEHVSYANAGGEDAAGSVLMVRVTGAWKF